MRFQIYDFQLRDCMREISKKVNIFSMSGGTCSAKPVPISSTVITFIGELAAAKPSAEGEKVISI